MPWFVLYTKSRNEKIVAEKLRAKNIEVYCPMIKRPRQWSDRVKVVEEPLFRSYCFVRLEERQRHEVFSVPGLVRYLFWEGKPAIVRDAEIDSIKSMLADVDHQLIQIKPLRPGTQMTIKSGSFRDSTGTVIRQDGKIVTVVLESLQMVLKVDLTTTAIVG
ncbi:UpxY family transcription antiterminator [Spirosoma fluviale]|uniref:Transcription antitermination factor NusG n=1 Tax=Spirosoma fluviale TaxID=1597977 RepID=A0A286G9H5_9BACT|nr:UpxY family transcription antiterminator [Spirosoma fluviale]SOD91644.1 Transcription antitermination factor NusG [Spirosoma fluviale]